MTDDTRVPYSPAQAEAMRQVFRLLEKWGVSSAELARRTGATPRTFDNFLDHNRAPSYTTWRKYYEFAYKELATTAHPHLIALLKSATAASGNTALASLANIVPDTIPSDAAAIANSRGGTYLTYSFSYFPGYINVSWMKIFYDQTTYALSFEYRYRTYRDNLRRVTGYIIPTNRTLNFIGSIDRTSQLGMAIVRRPTDPETKVDFLDGILLSVNRDGFPFAAKIVMKPQPANAAAEEYDSLIKMRPVSETRLEHESPEAFEKRQEFLNHVRSINDLYSLIKNENKSGEALTLFPLLPT